MSKFKKHLLANKHDREEYFLSLYDLAYQTARMKFRKDDLGLDELQPILYYILAKEVDKEDIRNVKEIEQLLDPIYTEVESKLSHSDGLEQQLASSIYSVVVRAQALFGQDPDEHETVEQKLEAILAKNENDPEIIAQECKESIHYDHATLGKGRFHALSLDASGLSPTLQTLTGDALKTAILLNVKKDLDKLTDVSDVEKYKEKFIKKPEYAVLKSAQGLITYFFRRDTSSVDAFNNLIAQATTRCSQDVEKPQFTND
ncbi:hypothetical protein [Legionella bozemanae]|uniref:hypothetical protein n=1 Tax=Legionella bozemanae TaxID=447 RepID=UPI001040F3A6|nr:hypothetical protein [Legionella bozemanae]